MHHTSTAETAHTHTLVLPHQWGGTVSTAADTDRHTRQSCSPYWSHSLPAVHTTVAIDLHYPQTTTTDTPTIPSLPPPTNSSGVTYIRWGRTSCPTGNGTEYVYNGITAGSWYSYSGGGSNYICLVKNPKYPQEATTSSGNYIYGTEYETGGGPLNEVSQNNPPCAACHVTTRSAQLMVPGTDECPGGWTLEYAGWLVSAHQSHYRTMYVCLDKDAEVLEGEEANTDDALMYNTVVDCGGYGIPCPPYVNQKDLACAVCTK